MIPDFCAKTRKQEIEPYMTLHTELLEMLDFDLNIGRKNSPSVLVFLNKLGQQAYQEVDNPVYDRDACQKWKEERMKEW